MKQGEYYGLVIPMYLPQTAGKDYKIGDGHWEKLRYEGRANKHLVFTVFSKTRSSKDPLATVYIEHKDLKYLDLASRFKP